jgi:hypothetical protein
MSKSVPLYRGVVRGLCLAAKWPEPQFEVRVTPTRRWRYDISWPEHKLAVEVQGGVWLKRGGHTGGQAQIDDMEKFSWITVVERYRLILCTPGQTCDGTLTTWLHRAFDTETR